MNDWDRCLSLKKLGPQVGKDDLPSRMCRSFTVKKEDRADSDVMKRIVGYFVSILYLLLA